MGSTRSDPRGPARATAAQIDEPTHERSESQWPPLTPKGQYLPLVDWGVGARATGGSGLRNGGPALGKLSSHSVAGGGTESLRGVTDSGAGSSAWVSPHSLDCQSGNHDHHNDHDCRTGDYNDQPTDTYNHKPDRTRDYLNQRNQPVTCANSQRGATDTDDHKTSDYHNNPVLATSHLIHRRDSNLDSGDPSWQQAGLGGRCHHRRRVPPPRSP